MSDYPFVAPIFNIHLCGISLVLHGRCRVKLLPSGRKLCVHHSTMHQLKCHFNQSHIGRVYVCLAVTCHLHFWRNDRDRLRATVVTKGRNGYRNKSQHRKLSLIFFFFFFSPATPAGTRTRDLLITSPTL